MKVSVDITRRFLFNNENRTIENSLNHIYIELTMDQRENQ